MNQSTETNQPKQVIQLRKQVDQETGAEMRFAVIVDFETRNVETVDFAKLVDNFTDLTVNTDWENPEDALTMRVMLHLITQSLGITMKDEPQDA